MANDVLLLQVRSLVAELGYELVDFQRRGTARAPLVEVRVDRPASEPGQGVTTDDCVKVTRALEAAWVSLAPLAVETIFEVSSPGIERPVRFADHWQRYVGRQVRVRSKALPGKPVATIAAVPDDAHVTLTMNDGTARTIGLDEIQEATLVFDWGANSKKQG